jgi:oxygen-independent coproporphyrinogen-3 oxidase
MHPADLLPHIDRVCAARDRNPLALYVHIPFCRTKCHFCDWVADVPVMRLRSGPEQRRGYVDALRDQIAFYGPQLTRAGYEPIVMYWGGGTPTRLEVDEMQAVHQALDASFDLSTVHQWTIETTPNDLTHEKLDAMVELGVNRVSMGVQSFSPRQLRRAARSHTREDAIAGVELLRRHGPGNFNIDLICGFPGEDLQSLRETMQIATELGPPHVSVYPYRATPATVMAMQLERSETESLDEGRMLEAYELAAGALRDAGYEEYSHGYWVRDRAYVDHDGHYKYALGGDKIGFGSGAESILGHHVLLNESTRFDAYLCNPVEFTFGRRYSLDELDDFTALVGGALMTNDGLDFAAFERLTGIPFADVRATPFISSWLAGFGYAGARFLEDAGSLRIEPEVIHRVYIAHLAHTTAAGMAQRLRARPPAPAAGTRNAGRD